MSKAIVIGVGLSLAVLAACAPMGKAGRTVTLLSTGALATNEASKVVGTAEIAVLGDGTTKVSLMLSGMVAGSKHAAHIHTGSCVNQGGVAVPLPDVVAGADGSGSSEKVIQTGSIPAAAYVNVHQKGSDEGVGGGISCGDIQ
jgi:Cu/Zn superoxide dismutase